LRFLHSHAHARGRGESEERLYLLDAWRESPLYAERERAALAWTETVTLVAQTHVPDAVFEEVRRHLCAIAGATRTRRRAAYPAVNSTDLMIARKISAATAIAATLAAQIVMSQATRRSHL